MERLKKRDIEILRFIARVGAAQPQDIRTRFRLSRATAYRRLKLLSELGHLDRRTNLSPVGNVFIATGSGISMAEVPLREAKVTGIGGVTQHLFAMTDVVSRIEGVGIDCLTEREIFAHKRIEESNRYCFPLMRPKNRHIPDHRPDIVCELPNHDRFVAIEVECSPKSNLRWDDILYAFHRRLGLDGFAGVLYLVGPGSERNRLARRAERAGLGERFQILERTSPNIVPTLDAIFGPTPRSSGTRGS